MKKKTMVGLALAVLMMSISVSAYTWVNQTVSVQNMAANSPKYSATLWAYTTAGPWCWDSDGFNPTRSASMGFYSTEENRYIYQADFCHPILENTLVELACPSLIRVNGVAGTEFPRHPGLFLFDCGSIGKRCYHNRCVDPK